MNKLSREQLEKLLPKIELVPIDQIKLNPNNPRTISQRKFDNLVKSVDDFWQMLFLRPVVLDEDDMVLGGNMRTQAARKAGFTELPCIRAMQLSDQQRAEFIIKDNLPFGDWDFDALANNWDSGLLNDWGMTVPVMPKFSGMNDDDDLEASRPRTRGEKQEQDPGFNILIKCDTELRRQQVQQILEDNDMVDETDFYLI